MQPYTALTRKRLKSKARPYGERFAQPFTVMYEDNSAAAAPAGKHVLIVDDDPRILSIIEQWLTTAGYSVMACSGYQAAKEHLARTRPDVLLTDVRLGAFNGLQLAMFAKAQKPNTRTMVMSGFDDQLLQNEAARYGACFIAKPFTRAEVLVALENVTH